VRSEDIQFVLRKARHLLKKDRERLRRYLENFEDNVVRQKARAHRELQRLKGES